MTDINTKACQVSMKTMHQNNITTTDAVTTSITTALVDRLQGTVDILLCNPPYVPTPSEEVNKFLNCSGVLSWQQLVGSYGIAASWAGGAKGREVFPRFNCLYCHLYKFLKVIDQLLPSVNKLLSPQGLFYLLCVRENKPGDKCL